VSLQLLEALAASALVLTAARLRRLVHQRRRVVIVALGVIVLAGAVAQRK